MKPKFFLLTLLVCLLFQANSYGYIMLIGTNVNDQTVVDVLEKEGYTVFRGLNYTGIVSAEKLDSLNNADLIIFSRNGGTNGYGTGDGVAQQWADITAPILSLSPWIMRSSRWMWVNSADSPPCVITDTLYIPTDALSHPIFTNVEVVDQMASFTLPDITRNEAFAITDALDMGNGIVIGLDIADDREVVMAVEWEAGYPFYEGSLTPESNRMYLAITEGDNCKLETVRANVNSTYNGTDNGTVIFLNSVAYMQGIEIVSSRNISAFKNQLTIYPNPGKEVVYIKGLKNVTNYQIIDIKGSVVNTGKTLNSVDVSGLRNGLYVFKSIDTNQSVRFIKE